MASATQPNHSAQKEQQHPQQYRDRQIADRLLQEEASPYNLAELARLKIRYTGFPGSRDIQTDLEKVLQKWQLTEDRLFENTRQLHATGQIYTVHCGKREDWD
jgi:hypothetical protein